jgi:hypothetical protein
MSPWRDLCSPGLPFLPRPTHSIAPKINSECTSLSNSIPVHPKIGNGAVHHMLSLAKLALPSLPVARIPSIPITFRTTCQPVRAGSTPAQPRKFTVQYDALDACFDARKRRIQQETLYLSTRIVCQTKCLRPSFLSSLLGPPYVHFELAFPSHTILSVPLAAGDYEGLGFWLAAVADAECAES